MRRPNETHLASYEKALIAELAKAIKAIPLVRLIDVAPERGEINRNVVETGPLPADYQGIRHHAGGKKYEHGDPTADRALSVSRPKEWLERFEKMQAELSWLSRVAVELVGEPVDICPCTKPILDDEPTRQAQGQRWHQRCYLRHSRGKSLETSAIS